MLRRCNVPGMCIYGLVLACTGTLDALDSLAFTPQFRGASQPIVVRSDTYLDSRDSRDSRDSMDGMDGIVMVRP